MIYDQCGTAVQYSRCTVVTGVQYLLEVLYFKYSTVVATATATILPFALLYLLQYPPRVSCAGVLSYYLQYVLQYYSTYYSIMACCLTTYSTVRTTVLQYRSPWWGCAYSTAGVLLRSTVVASSTPPRPPHPRPPPPRPHDDYGARTAVLAGGIAKKSFVISTCILPLRTTNTVPRQ